VNHRVLRSAGVAIVFCTFAACGKKGPPLPPLHIVPDVVTDVSARRAGDEVRIRFVLPSKNANGPNPVNLAKVEVLAATIAAGAMAPPNREFLNARYVVGTIEVEPPADEGAAATAEDPRPSPGEPAVFVEKLTDAVLKPQFTELPPAPAPAAAPAQPAATTAPAQPMRIYTIRGVARNGRPGRETPRIRFGLPCRTTKTIVEVYGALLFGSRSRQPGRSRLRPLVRSASTSYSSASVTTSASSPSMTARACRPEPPCDIRTVTSCRWSWFHFAAKARLKSS